MAYRKRNLGDDDGDDDQAIEEEEEEEEYDYAFLPKAIPDEVIGKVGRKEEKRRRKNSLEVINWCSGIHMWRK